MKIFVSVHHSHYSPLPIHVCVASDSEVLDCITKFSEENLNPIRFGPFTFSPGAVPSGSIFTVCAEDLTHQECSHGSNSERRSSEHIELHLDAPRFSLTDRSDLVENLPTTSDSEEENREELNLISDLMACPSVSDDGSILTYFEVNARKIIVSKLDSQDNITETIKIPSDSCPMISGSGNALAYVYKDYNADNNNFGLYVYNLTQGFRSISTPDSRCFCSSTFW